MSDVECPCCKKGVQARHTYMANLPATVVCTGCGSWFKIDVENSGGKALVGLSLVTLILAYFWPIVLVFLPVLFVMSMGSLQTFKIEMLQEPRTEVWTISRETGEIYPLKDKEGSDEGLILSEKFKNLSPTSANVFRQKAEKYKAHRARAWARGANKRSTTIGSIHLPPQLSH